jgi:hypothetical protein
MGKIIISYESKTHTMRQVCYELSNALPQLIIAVTYLLTYTINKIMYSVFIFLVNEFIYF